MGNGIGDVAMKYFNQNFWFPYLASMWLSFMQSVLVPLNTNYNLIEQSFNSAKVSCIVDFQSWDLVTNPSGKRFYYNAI